MPIKACQPCRHLDYCKSQWGTKCREHGGRKIPKLKKDVNIMMRPEPPDAVASVYWMSGRIEHFTKEDL